MHNKELKEVTIFFTTTLFLSYFVFWGPIALFKIPTVNLVEGPVGPLWAILLFVIGGFVPSITGIILTAIFDGKKGIQELFRKAIQVKIGIKWFIITILIAGYLVFSLTLLYTILGGKFDFSQFLIQLPTILPLIVLGPISEEFGWRGFAIKKMLRHTNPVLTSLIIGLIWSLWHLPLFFILGSSQYEFNLPFFTFLLSVTSSSFIYTYLYIKTKQSIFSAIFFHWIYTYVAQVMGSSVIRTNLYNWLEFIPVMLLGIVFIFLLRKQKGVI